MKTLKAIIDFVFGKKHYFVVITRVGFEDQGYMTHSDIFDTKKEAEDCMYRIAGTRTFVPHFIQSFRSHMDFEWHKEDINK